MEGCGVDKRRVPSKHHEATKIHGSEAGSLLHYAGIWSRFAALLLDFLLLSAVFFPITRLVKGVWLMQPGDHLWSYGWFVSDPLCVSFLTVIFLYFSLLEGLAGATFGKWMLGLRVVRPGKGRPGFVRGIIRNVSRLVDALPILNILGVILIATSPERARFGDRVARTRVVFACRPDGRRGPATGIKRQ
jgi:uncharacterized RDD family membrane protein YckC